MKPTWEKPKTTKIYLHAPGANRILMIHPDAKITNLALKNEGRHTRQDACGVHLMAGKAEPQALDFHLTRFDTVRDGLPFYTILGDDPENGCKLSMSAFATDDKNPLTYVRVTVSNEENHPVEGSVGLLPREAHNGDQYLTGLLDTGYESYQPNLNQWLLQRIMRFNETSPLCAAAPNASMRILSADGFSVRWITREEQPHRFRAQDYFACDYTLDAGRTITLDFVLCASPMEGDVKTYDVAKTYMTAFWQERLSHVKVMPKTDSPRIRDMYLQNITQCMQMVAQYDGMDGIVVRQGDVGRFLWIWEAVHVLKCLALVGLPEYAPAAYDTYCSWMTMEGENRGKLNYRYVGWDNAEGALLLGLSEHLKIVEDFDLYLHYRPYMMALLEYIDRRRHSDPNSKYPGLYPAGQASDWGEIGFHWTFTDAYVLRSVRSYLQVCEKYHAEETETVRAIEADYTAAIDRIAADLYAGHENDESFILPHIAGVPFEDSYNHCFYTDGAPFLNLVGVVMDPNSRMFEQMENFYRENGLFEHDLAGRITNATDFGVGVYGDCYYTGIAEICWIYPWMARGEWDKAEKMFNAMMRYNVTEEYIVSERYCSIDPWYVPWQPNGSGSGRLCMFLLDYFEKKANA
ncbi:MAG: hypothetical protein IJ449_02830 [Clostridia bacterium]|nr:hypothetical protein [Clostridia bacterium]